MKKYAVTYPVMMISLVLSLTLFFTYYGIQQSTNDRNPLDGSMMFLRAKAMRIAPSAGYSFVDHSDQSRLQETRDILDGFR